MNPSLIHTDRRPARRTLVLSLAFAILHLHPALAATVSLKAFDQIAQNIELEYIQSGTSEIKRLPMERQVFGVWQVDFPAPAGDYEYRFVTDGEWISDIGNPQFNRWADGSVWSQFSVPGENDSYSNYRRDAPAQRPANIFHVAVTYADPRCRSVAIAGEFNQWNHEPMRRSDDGQWRVSFDLAEGSYAYKLIIDGTWMLDPANSLRKSVNGTENSVLVVSSNTTVAPEKSGKPEPPADVGEKVAVTFKFYAPLATEVAVVGSFNNWNGEQNKMVRRDDMWECTLSLPEGTCEYKFKVDGNWFWDPDQPPASPGGDSVLTVKRPLPEPAGQKALIQPEQWKDSTQILLEPATGLHNFQQELMRAYVYVIGSDQYKLKIADGSLLNPDNLPVNPPARWGWSIDHSAGLSMMTLTVQSNTAAFELKHPLLDPPGEWLAAQRRQAGKVFEDVALDLSGPKVPPTNSAWATAREELARRRPFSDVYAINRMTEFGRQAGWSRALLREIAATYADMSADCRHPGLGGWAPMVFAARAVVYADLARTGKKTDETMAYVLCRIGRPGDGATFLPAKPNTLHGKLAAAMARGEIDQLLAWAGSSDNYGLDAAKGQPTHAPAMDGFTAAQKAQILSTLSDLLTLDGQANLARCYLGGALKSAPWDFANLVRALELGGVSAGHDHAGEVLKLSGCPKLWNSVLQGTAPLPCDMPQPRGPFAVLGPMANRNSTAEDIAEISTLYQDQQYKMLDCVTEPVPQSARLLLLRDMLNLAWWENARFYGISYYSKSGCQRLNQLMATWKPFQPEMEAFTRFLMTHALDDHDYGAIQRGFTDSPRKPNTLDYILMVRHAFRTWLMDKAQSYYPLVPTVQSDLYPDYALSEDVYVFQSLDHLRANCRRLAPLYPYGYPAPGPLPKPGNPGDIPAQLFDHSYGLNRKLAGDWSRTFDQESQAAARAFFQQCLKICPYEIGTYHDYAHLLMDNGEYQEAISLVESRPDTMEGLERAGMQRLGTYAALEIGDTNRALSFAKSAADTWQSLSMSVYAYALEINGDLSQSETVLAARDGRYGGQKDIYMLARQKPEKAEALAPELFSWIEQFPDLNKANNEGRFSFNAVMDLPYIYASLDRWDRALWLLKPMAEAVQNDFIWFGLMAVGQKTGDMAAMELGQHVLANHVFNVWGDFARFMRNQTTWEEVLRAARNEDKPQPMYVLAAIIAEQRGDVTLATRLYKQTLDPRFSTGPWFTMAWRALKRLDHDPMAFVQRNFPAAETQPK